MKTIKVSCRLQWYTQGVWRSGKVDSVNNNKNNDNNNGLNVAPFLAMRTQGGSVAVGSNSPGV